MLGRASRAGRVPARLAIRAALALRRRLLSLADAAVPPQLVLFEQGMGLARTQLLQVAARLGLADLLDACPRTADALARETGADPDALFRALRALAAGGVFELRPDGLFQNNRASRALRASAPGSMRSLLEYLGSAAHVAAWADAGRTIESGKNAFERVHGMSVWDWFTQHRDEECTFADAMGKLAELDAPAIAAGYPFGNLTRICDVAGGQGALLAGSCGGTRGRAGSVRRPRGGGARRPCSPAAAWRSASPVSGATSSRRCRRAATPTCCTTSCTTGTMKPACASWPAAGGPRPPERGCWWPRSWSSGSAPRRRGRSRTCR